MDSPVRLLWIGQRSAAGHGGDVIYDRRLIEACRQLGAEIDCLALDRVSRRRELVNLARGRPYYRARYDCSHNRALISQAAAKHDRAVCSWEPLDALAAHCPVPTIPILHNVTSQALRTMFPGHPLARLASAGAARWERQAYAAGNFPAIATLSAADRERVESIPGAAPVILAPPGMPPCVALAELPPLRRELLLWGSFEWAPKRRDVVAFARAYAQVAGRLPIMVDGALPKEAAKLLAPRASTTVADGAIRFGLIPDRFEAGFKLKSTAYLASNAIVLTFADIARDFAEIEDHELFIRRIARTADIAAHVDCVAALDRSELRARFALFKQRCAERFSWRSSARSLLAALRSAA